jgi:hypothetical protein
MLRASSEEGHLRAVKPFLFRQSVRVSMPMGIALEPLTDSDSMDLAYPCVRLLSGCMTGFVLPVAIYGYLIVSISIITIIIFEKQIG